MEKRPRSLILLSSFVTALVACSPQPNSSGESPQPTAPGEVRILAKGGPFQMVNGLHFGPDGLLYLASVVSPALASICPAAWLSSAPRVRKRFSSLSFSH